MTSEPTVDSSAPGLPARSILTGGWEDACLLASGKLSCWKVSANAPVVRDVRRFEGRWRAVSAGPLLTCAIDESSAVWCWGRNASGVLGALPAEGSDQPVLIDATHRWTSIAAGSGYACAIDDTRSMWCFGAADWGVAMVPPPPDRSTPRPIPGEFISVSSSWYSTSALAADGTVWSAQNDDRFAPVAAAAGLTFTQIVQGVHSFAAARSPEEAILVSSGAVSTISMTQTLFGVGGRFCVTTRAGTLACRDPLGFAPSTQLPLDVVPVALVVVGYVPCWLDAAGVVRCTRQGTEAPITVPFE